MTGSLDLGRWAVAACVLAAVALLVPIGLASVGFGALLAVVGGASTQLVSGPAGIVGQGQIDQTSSTAAKQGAPSAVGPAQSVVAAAQGLAAG